MSSQPIGETPGFLYDRALAEQAAGRFHEAVQLLWQASQQGDVPSMSLLGAQLMSGRGAPPDPPAGARLIFEAAERGGAYACALASSIAASTFAGPPEWERALDYLERSAELGHAPAQAQLKLLARFKGEVRPRPSAWSRLRRRVDLGAWRAAPAARTLLADPAMAVVERFASADVCDWIIERARERLAPAMVYDTGAFRPVQKQGRTNSVAGFDLVYLDLVVLLIRERLAQVCGRPVAAMEAPQVFHYAVGQSFAHHFDFLDAAAPGHAADLARKGQRAQTLLIYLNDGFEGGETDFPVLGLTFKGRKGDALTFTNVQADGSPERRMYHAGLSPTAGEKWLFSQWVRDRAQG